MIEVVAAIARANIVAALAILAVLALRRPARRTFGAELAYGLWLLPPLAAAASLLPARLSDDVAPALIHAAPLISARLAHRLLAAQVVGAGVGVLIMAAAQLAFLRLARQGLAGPAVVGVVCPRIVMPADDGGYTLEERTLIRAHEREHIARRDPQARAWMAVLQCLAWFNPLVHVAVRFARLDQELACDAAVLRRRRFSRADYARTLLKTQIATTPLPLGACWASRARHPLEIRIAALAHRGDNEVTGSALLCLGVLTAATLAWAAKPPVAPYNWVSPKFEAAANQPVMSAMLVIDHYGRFEARRGR